MASSSHSHSKKRKRGDADQSVETTLHLAPQKPGRLGPTLGTQNKKPHSTTTLTSSHLDLRLPNLFLFIYLVSFPSVQPPKKTPFNTYLRKAPKPPTAHTSNQDTGPTTKDVLIVGESDTVEFTSSPETEVASEGCR